MNKQVILMFLLLLVLGFAANFVMMYFDLPLWLRSIVTLIIGIYIGRKAA